MTIIFYISLVVILLGIFHTYTVFKIKKKEEEYKKQLEKKLTTILMLRGDINNLKSIFNTQRDQLVQHQRNIRDSIDCAKRIQTAIIPPLETIDCRLEYFVLYKPLNTVSGDFYWTSSQGNIQVIIVADCTGHGISGAFMSIMSIVMLNEIINEKCVYSPELILNDLRKMVIRALHQSEEDYTVMDGLDVAICVIDFDRNTLSYAGANRSLYFMRNGELSIYKADKMPASIYFNMHPFVRHRINLIDGDMFYMFSDGYADQIGGPRQRKFMNKHLEESLVGVSSLPIREQGPELDSIFEDWRGDHFQMDDVLLMGIKFNNF